MEGGALKFLLVRTLVLSMGGGLKIIQKIFWGLVNWYLNKMIRLKSEIFLQTYRNFYRKILFDKMGSEKKKKDALSWGLKIGRRGLKMGSWLPDILVPPFKVSILPPPQDSRARNSNLYLTGLVLILEMDYIQGIINHIIGQDEFKYKSLLLHGVFL